MSGLRRIAIRVPAGEAEAAAARLLELYPAGLEEQALGGEVELAVYAEEATERDLRAAFPDMSSEPVLDGWEDGWKEFHRPVWAGGLWIGPPWIEPPAGEPAVVVDPGRAFGTGAHATTRACIELLARLERGSLLDAGCGSGVLAVAAARLGFGPIHAFDVDPVAVEVARGTALRNDVAIDVFEADARRDRLPTVEVVVANIELDAVETLLSRLLAPSVVTSGYLAARAPRAPGRTRADRVELEGWAADLFVAD